LWPVGRSFSSIFFFFDLALFFSWIFASPSRTANFFFRRGPPTFFGFFLGPPPRLLKGFRVLLPWHRGSTWGRSAFHLFWAPGFFPPAPRAFHSCIGFRSENRPWLEKQTSPPSLSQFPSAAFCEAAPANYNPRALFFFPPFGPCRLPFPYVC